MALQDALIAYIGSADGHLFVALELYQGRLFYRTKLRTGAESRVRVSASGASGKWPRGQGLADGAWHSVVAQRGFRSRKRFSMWLSVDDIPTVYAELPELPDSLQSPMSEVFIAGIDLSGEVGQKAMPNLMFESTYMGCIGDIIVGGYRLELLEGAGPTANPNEPKATIVATQPSRLVVGCEAGGCTSVTGGINKKCVHGQCQVPPTNYILWPDCVCDQGWTGSTCTAGT
jgi:hypothetical protein